MINRVKKKRQMYLTARDPVGNSSKTFTINVADNATPESVLNELLRDASDYRHAKAARRGAAKEV